MPLIKDPLFEDSAGWTHKDEKTGRVTDMRELLSRPLEDFPTRPLLPPCYFYGECVDVVTGLSSNKGTRYFAFICQPQEWVPESEPQGADELLGEFKLTDYEFPNRDRCGQGLPAGQIWISPKAMPMNREFFDGMGFSSSKPMQECIPEMRGRKVMMEIGVEQSQSGRNFNVLTSLTRDPRQK